MKVGLDSPLKKFIQDFQLFFPNSNRYKIRIRTRTHITEIWLIFFVGSFSDISNYIKEQTPKNIFTINDKEMVLFKTIYYIRPYPISIINQGIVFVVLSPKHWFCDLSTISKVI